jgi:hypothetical protein
MSTQLHTGDSGGWAGVASVPLWAVVLRPALTDMTAVGWDRLTTALAVPTTPSASTPKPSRAPPSAPNGTTGTPACGWTPSTARTDH